MDLPPKTKISQARIYRALYHLRVIQPLTLFPEWPRLNPFVDHIKTENIDPEDQGTDGFMGYKSVGYVIRNSYI